MELIERIKIGAITPQGRKTYRYAQDMQDAQKKIQILRKRGHGSISTTEESFEPSGYMLEGKFKELAINKQEDDRLRKKGPSHVSASDINNANLKKKPSGFSKFNKVTSDLGYGPKKEEVVAEAEQLGIKDRKSMVSKGIYPKGADKKPLKTHLFFKTPGKDEKTGNTAMKKHDGISKSADDHHASTTKKVQEMIDTLVQKRLDEISTDTINSYADKAKKQRNDADYDRDSYKDDATRAKSKPAMKAKMGLAKQKDKISDKRTKGLGLANRALNKKGYEGGTSDYRHHDSNYDHKKADLKSGKLKEDGDVITKSLAKADLLRHLVSRSDK
tara:strand:- start:364 stop:1353 length:990 start_codon:yes stop_codon:yes gene_type:complete